MIDGATPNIHEIKLIALMCLSWLARLAVMSALTVGLVVRQLIISIFVGYIASTYFLSSSLDEWIKTSIFCASVFLADDILVILLAFGRYAKDNQTAIFARISKFLTLKG